MCIKEGDVSRTIKKSVKNLLLDPDQTYDVWGVGGGDYLVLGRGVLGGVREGGKESLSSSEVIQLSLSTALLFSSLLNK